MENGLMENNLRVEKGLAYFLGGYLAVVLQDGYLMTESGGLYE